MTDRPTDEAYKMTLTRTRRAGRLCARVILGWAILFAFVAFLLADAVRRAVT